MLYLTLVTWPRAPVHVTAKQNMTHNNGGAAPPLLCVIFCFAVTAVHVQLSADCKGKAMAHSQTIVKW